MYADHGPLLFALRALRLGPLQYLSARIAHTYIADLVSTCGAISNCGAFAAVILPYVCIKR